MYKKILFIIIVLTFILNITQLGLTFGRATDGDRLVQLESEISLLEKANEELLTQTQSLTVIDSIRKSANTLGMQPAKFSRLAPVSVAARLWLP